MIIIDSNIFFSALIKKSITREIIISSDIKFVLPDYVFNEINKHKIDLSKKSKLSVSELNTLINTLTKRIEIITKNKYIGHTKEAYEILKEIDLDDIPFIACALAFPGTIIWSNDKHLKLQNRIKIFNTKEIIKLLNT